MYSIKLLRNGNINVLIGGFETLIDALNFSKRFGFDPEVELKIVRGDL